MILTIAAPFGSTISLDFSKQFGERVELECFHFVIPPIEFRLMRKDKPLQDWQTAATEMYDLQHGPSVAQWGRDDHWFINDLDHRHDVMTCGVLSRDLILQTRGLGLQFVLLIWLREGTWRVLPGESAIQTRILDIESGANEKENCP